MHNQPKRRGDDGMSFEIAIVTMAIGSAVGVWGLLTFPRHVIQPWVVGKVWRLLDDIDDAGRRGDLVEDDRSVQWLRDSVCKTARVADQITLTDVVLANQRVDMYPTRPAKPSTGTLSSAHRANYHEFERRHRVLVAAVVFTGTWPGLIIISLTATGFVAQAIMSRLSSAVTQPPSDRVVTVSYAAVEHEVQIIASRHPELAGAR